MTPKETMQKAIDTYGVENQIMKTVEELSELSQALCKFLSKPYTESDRTILDNIYEEIADVEIMLEQCKMMFQCDKEVSGWKQDKVKRLERRMEKISSSIVAIPKADTQEVKHTKWIEYKYKLKCSNCNTLIDIDDVPEKICLNYCPNCGAKMDSERND